MADLTRYDVSLGVRTRSRSPGVLFGVTLVLLVAWGVRLFAYGTEELGLDGNLSVGIALQPIPRLLAFLARDVHPPLYYLMLKVWLGLVGVNFLAARWLTLAAGLLTLVILYQLVSRVAGEPGALVAIVLLVFSPAHVAASATVRDFSLGLLFSVGSLAVWDDLDRPRPQSSRRWRCVVLAILTALALATWYFHLLFVVVQLLDLARRPKGRRDQAIALGMGLVAQLPWLAVTGGLLLGKLLSHTTVSGEPPALASVPEVMSHLGRDLAGTLPPPLPTPLGAIAWALLVALGLVALRKTRWLDRTIEGGVLGAIAVYGLASIWASATLLGRYGLILLPWAALALAGSFRKTNVPRRTRIIAFVVVAYALAGLVVIAQVTDFVGLLRLEGLPGNRPPAAMPGLAIIETNARASDAIVFGDLARTGQYSLRGRGVAPATTIHFAGSAFLRDDVAAEAAAWLPPLVASHDRIWFLYDAMSDSGSVATIEGQLAADRFRVHQERDAGTVVDIFAPGPPLATHPLNARFGGQIDLTSWAMPTGVRPGTSLYVELRWRANQRPDADYTVFAQLLDDRGQKIAQHDGAPVLGTRPTSTWQVGDVVVDRFVIDVPATAVAGSDQLLVGLYRGNNRLKLANGDDAMTIGPVDIPVS